MTDETEYLRGNTSSNDCEELFSKYKSCLNVGDLYAFSILMVIRVPWLIIKPLAIRKS